MSKNKINYLAKRLFWRNKKNILRVLIGAVIIFITVMGANIYSTIENYVELNLEQSLDAKMLMVSSNDKNYTLEDVEKITADIKEIVDVFDYAEFDITSNLKAINGKIINKTIVLQQALNNYPLLSKGRDIKEDREIICGEGFIPIGDLEYSKVTKDDILPLKVDDILTMSFNKYDGFSYLETINVDLKVVGFFKNNFYAYDNNVCFTSIATIEKIKELIDEEKSKEVVTLLIDKYENVDKVVDILDKRGIDGEKVFRLDEDLIKTVKIISYLVLLGCLVASTMMLAFLRRKMQMERENNEILYNILGYKDEEIKQINYVIDKWFMFLVLSLAFVFCLLCYVIYKLIFIINPFIFYRFTLDFNIPLIILSILVLMLGYFGKYLKRNEK